MLEAPQYFSTARGLSIRQDIGRIGRGLGLSSRRKGTSAGGGLNHSPIASGCMVVADGVADPTVRVIDRHLRRSSAAGPAPIAAKTRRRQGGARPGWKDHRVHGLGARRRLSAQGRCNQRSDHEWCLQMHVER